MGSIGDNDDKIEPIKRSSTVDHSPIETRTIDNLLFPPLFSGGEFEADDADELQFLHSTVPFDDNVMLEDVFETQVVNLGGETQALDNLDCVENIGNLLLDDFDTEVVVDSECEGTDRTEVLGDTEELSDDDSMKRVGTRPMDQENTLYTTLRKQVEGGFKAESDALSNKEHSSGTVHRGFTSVRTAAIRANGLAARSMSFKGTNSGLSSITSDGQFLKQNNVEHNGIPVIRDSSNFVEEIDQEHAVGEYEMEGLTNENKCRVGRSTVRKLFTQGTLAKIKGLDDYTDNADRGADSPQWFASESELAGLSYVDSQEPGELSQANALDVVDRFLKVNVLEFGEEVEIGKSTGEKLKPVSSAKGTQRLAKSANLISTIGERGIFNWDDNREDEGGGEFFRKKKEAFFDNGGQPRKPRCLKSKSGRAVEESGEKEEQLDIHDKPMGLVYTDSKSSFLSPKGNDESATGFDAKFRKNLIRELDEQIDIGSRAGLGGTGIDQDMPDMWNIGFDTQMAAEAMEALCFGVVGTDPDRHDANQGAKDVRNGCLAVETKNRVRTRQTSRNKARSSNSGVITRQSKLKKGIATKLSTESSISSLKRSTKVRNQCDGELVRDRKRVKSGAKEHFGIGGSENFSKVPSKIIVQTTEEKSLKRSNIDEIDRCHIAASSGQMSVKKRRMLEQLATFTPIACRTRQCTGANQSLRGGEASSDLKEGMNDLTGSTKDKRMSRTGVDDFAKDKSIEVDSNQSGELKNAKLTQREQDRKSSDTTGDVKIDASDHPTRRRTTRQKLLSVGQEANGQSIARLKRPQTDAISTHVDLGITRKTQSSMCAGPVLPSLDRQSRERLFQQSVRKISSVDTYVTRNSVDLNGNAIARVVVGAQAFRHSIGKNDVDIMSYAEGAEANARLEASPRERCEQSTSACNTPVNCVTSIKELSPVCMGDEYLKQTRRKNPRSSQMKEVNRLIAARPEPTSAVKDSRRKRDVTNVKVLFSNHLDGDIIEHQKKILARLGASVASSISDATHFIADKFVRTRNMLEAIAFGKPVVTHSWLESCGQANCVIDERNYILRDAKKEKELGFSLPDSLARVCQHPLLQGQRVLITPNTKPGKEILASLVKAAHGVAVARIGRSALKDDKIPDDLLVVSCEEDYAVCVPFLEKGAAVYSSELLLNGIVIQKLEYERHRLFADHIKRTRSTIWLKKDNNQYHPVTKCK